MRSPLFYYGVKRLSSCEFPAIDYYYGIRSIPSEGMNEEMNEIIVQESAHVLEIAPQRFMKGTCLFIWMQMTRKTDASYELNPIVQYALSNYNKL